MNIDEPNAMGQATALAATIDYFDDVPPAPAEPATLEALSELAFSAAALEVKIQKETVALAEEQERLNKMLRVRIPEIMATLGMDSFKLTDGSTVAIKESINANITAENKPAAFAWLEKNDFDGIIKTNVTASFGKGEIEKAREAQAILGEAGFGALLDRSVHAMTLKSFVKERLEAGDNIPVDVFGIHEYKIAKISLPKAKKPSGK